MEGLPLGHVEASLNVNEKKLVEALLDKFLIEDLEVELVAGDSQLESERVFSILEERKIANVIAWRRFEGRENLPYVLVVEDRIDVEDPEHLRVMCKRLRAMAESLNGKMKSRLDYYQLT